jgi:glycine C-acetyltransferase/8-amino-7-oxononanoate synthase
LKKYVPFPKVPGSGEPGAIENGTFEFECDLEQARAEHRYRSLRVFSSRPDLLIFADNDYLGLAEDPRVIRSFQEAAGRYGVGAKASRLISGTSDLHEALERKIATFKGKEKSLVFTTGYMANLGIITALCGPQDLIVMDKLNHASLIDAARLSGATLRITPHKNLSKLETVLERSGSFRRKLIVTDGVFSMDGDLAPLRELVRLKDKYQALLMVDEAHAIGVFGARGGGVTEHFGVTDSVDIAMGTLSKAIGGLGGFVAASTVLIDCFINFSRSFLFATALPPAICAAALEALRIVEEEPERRQRLWRNVDRVKSALTNLGFALGSTESPILPLIVGDEAEAVQLSNRLWDEGIFIPAIRYPTVARGQARLRLTVSARHTEAEIDRLLAAMKRIVDRRL